MNMVGNIGGALSLILFPLMVANTFFALAISINAVAILCWCFMNPNRVNDRRLSPAAIRVRFIAMITVCTALLAGAIGYNLYTGFQKNKAASMEANKQAASIDVNTPDVNEPENEVQ